MEFDVPIKTTEQAKLFFKTIGCSSFHMSREYPDRYEEYRALNINKVTEAEWVGEEIESAIEQLGNPATQQGKLWTIHSGLSDLVVQNRFDNYLGRVLDATIAIEPLLPHIDRLLVAETIVGRNPVRNRSGLIFLSYDSTHKNIAERFARLAQHLVTEPFSSSDVENSRPIFEIQCQDSRHQEFMGKFVNAWPANVGARRLALISELKKIAACRRIRL